jgi:diadenosine tetraphosphate (Ap4A) HIT family hydrolase
MGPNPIPSAKICDILYQNFKKGEYMTDCVFCDPEKFKTRTIASIDGVNIVATLGQITEGGYVLLIPTDHVPCLGAMNNDQIGTIKRIASRIIQAIKQEYQKPVTIFEHGIVGQTIKHAHLHFLPANIDLSHRIQSDFPESEIQTIKGFDELQQMYRTRQEPYLLWSTPSGQFSVCWSPPAQPQYLRIISAETLHVPERADWKKMDPELDKELINETICLLAPCFN